MTHKMITHRVLGKMFDEKCAALFMYDPANPFSCKVMFSGANIWEFSREVLMQCLREGSAGYLNVTFDSDGDTVVMHLASESGSTNMSFPHGELTTFVHMTYNVVPAGKESEFLDFDGLISEILAKTKTD